MTAFALIAVAACANRTQLPTIELSIAGHEIRAEVADEPEERYQGLMYRKSMGTDDGMVFVYPREEPRSFWMANTTIPLSIAYLDAGGRILNIEPMTPLDRSGVRSAGPAQYALEMNRGWFDSHGVRAGDTVEGLPGPAQE